LEWLSRKISILFPVAEFTADFANDLLAGWSSKAYLEEPIADVDGSIASGFVALAFEGRLMLNLLLDGGGLAAADKFPCADRIVPSEELIFSRCP
jgi:hypothetical protein